MRGCIAWLGRYGEPLVLEAHSSASIFVFVSWQGQEGSFFLWFSLILLADFVDLFTAGL
jgi:cytochrome c biogenesis factor